MHAACSIPHVHHGECSRKLRPAARPLHQADTTTRCWVGSIRLLCRLWAPGGRCRPVAPLAWRLSPPGRSPGSHGPESTTLRLAPHRAGPESCTVSAKGAWARALHLKPFYKFLEKSRLGGIKWRQWPSLSAVRCGRARPLWGKGPGVPLSPHEGQWLRGGPGPPGGKSVLALPAPARSSCSLEEAKAGQGAGPGQGVRASGA